MRSVGGQEARDPDTGTRQPEGDQVSLSVKGRRLVERVTELRRREIAAIVERVPSELWSATVAALSAFAEAAGELPQQAWALGWS